MSENSPIMKKNKYEIIGIENNVIIDKLKDFKPQLFPTGEKELPSKVDLSKYLHFIRKQGGLGCWGYSFLAIWDIMNEMVCPYSPNLSFRLWKTIFYKHHVWEVYDDIYSPDGRYHDVKCLDLKNDEEKRCGSLNKGNPPFFTSFGCTTEGTDPSLHDYPARYQDLGWSTEGVNEAHNYRLEGDRIKIAVDSETFIDRLAQSHPIQISGGDHVVAVVGYDKNAKTFKILDSGGDKLGNGGYHTITFDQVDKKEKLWFLGDYISHAYILPKWEKIPPPKPVPAARIQIKHNDERGNIQLWIGIEDSPLPKNKIWSHGWKDNSRSLHYTVRLPSEFIWPPSEDNRIILELYDSAIYSKNSGGEIIEFTAAFGGHVIKCEKLALGSIKFKSRDRLYLTIP